MKRKFEFFSLNPEFKPFVRDIIKYLNSLPGIYPEQIINQNGLNNYGFFESKPYKGSRGLRQSVRGADFIIAFKKKRIIFTEEDIEYVEKENPSFDNPRCSYFAFRESSDIDREMNFLYEVDGLTPEHHLIIDVIKNQIKSYHKFYYRKALEEFERQINREEFKKLELSNAKSIILASVRKDGNGKLDISIGDNDFTKLVKKHQSKIIGIDRTYMQHFVKLTNYQKQKRKNIQSMFRSISMTKNESEKEMNNQVGLLKEQMHSFELTLFHSLNLVTSLVEDDMLTFYEVYESFDKLKIFNSNHENEVSKRLMNIEGGIYDLINSSKQTEKNIIKELRLLKYVTRDSYNELSRNVSKQLESIDSTLKVGNLISAINAYQSYKINKNTKGLRLNK